MRAHQRLDRAAFPTELSRLEFLFEQYRQLRQPLLPPAPKARRAARTVQHPFPEKL